MSMPNISNAAINVQNTCEKRLLDLYPAGIPDTVMNRYKKELEYFKQLSSEEQSRFEVFRLLCNEARKTMQLFGYVRLTDGSSFIIFLLSDSLMNPLPAHYYCEKCGYFQEEKVHLPGIDLPEKKCPECGNELRRDGFNLYSELVYSIDGRRVHNFESYATSDFFPYAKRVLENVYPQNKIVPMGKTFRTSHDEEGIMFWSGFYILPENKTIQDYPELINYLADEVQCLSGEWQVDPAKYELCPIFLLHNDLLEQLLHLQQKTGVRLHHLVLENLTDINWCDLRNTCILDEVEHGLVSWLEPKSFQEMGTLVACAKNYYDDIEYSDNKKTTDGLIRLIQSPEFREYPCYMREDFWETIEGMGIERTDAFWLMEDIRKGKIAYSNEQNY